VRNLTGEKFGRWTVLGPDEKRHEKRRWKVRCECGAERVVFERPLLAGESRSCGCLRAELPPPALKHGASARGREAPEYHSWRSMIGRCCLKTDRYFANYGGRGITVCQRWRESFEAFRADMGPRPLGRTLDRIDVNGNYEPGNCRWATAREQGEHRTDNRLITFNGETRTLTDWASAKGLSVGALWRRLESGWPVDKALNWKKPQRAA